jgi:hypothetical protein
MAHKSNLAVTPSTDRRTNRNRTKEQRLPIKLEKTRYAEVTIAALTGEISAEHLYNPPPQPDIGSTSGIWPLERALENLADGGFVFDLRPLADHPNIASWAVRAPMPSGRIDGDDRDRLSDEAREAAGEMVDALQGDFRTLAILASKRFGEPLDGSAGPFDYVSSTSRTLYWGSRGALIGRRVGNLLCWSDGRQQTIGNPDAQNATLPCEKGANPHGE